MAEGEFHGEADTEEGDFWGPGGDYFNGFAAVARANCIIPQSGVPSTGALHVVPRIFLAAPEHLTESPELEAIQLGIILLVLVYFF